MKLLTVRTITKIAYPFIQIGTIHFVLYSERPRAFYDQQISRTNKWRWNNFLFLIVKKQCRTRQRLAK